MKAGASSTHSKRFARPQPSGAMWFPRFRISTFGLPSAFGFRASDFFRHSSFDFRHSRSSFLPITITPPLPAPLLALLQALVHLDVLGLLAKQLVVAFLQPRSVE